MGEAAEMITQLPTIAKPVMAPSKLRESEAAMATTIEKIVQEAISQEVPMQVLVRNPGRKSCLLLTVDALKAKGAVGGPDDSLSAVPDKDSAKDHPTKPASEPTLLQSRNAASRT